MSFPPLRRNGVQRKRGTAGQAAEAEAQQSTVAPKIRFVANMQLAPCKLATLVVSGGGNSAARNFCKSFEGVGRRGAAWARDSGCRPPHP